MADNTGISRRTVGTGSGIYERLLRPDQSRSDANDSAWSSQVDDRVAALGLNVPGTSLNETRKSRNVWNLPPGVYGGFEHVSNRNVINGASQGAVFTKKCVFKNQATVVGVEFSDDDDLGADCLVEVQSQGGKIANIVQFINCRFRRSSVTMPRHARFLDGAAGIFIGCYFMGFNQHLNDASDGIVQNTSGTAAQVQLVGCVNTAQLTNPWGDVTTTACFSLPEYP